MNPTRQNRYDEFRARIEDAINILSLEQGSDTPDFILADYLVDCLKAYDRALQERHRYTHGDDEE